MAPYVQHAGAMVVPNRIKQEQSTVQEGGRAEAAVLGGRIGKGGDLKGAQRLWDHPWDVPILQVPGESAMGSRLWLAGSDPEYDKGARSLEEVEKDPDQGGSKATGVRIFPQSRRPVGVDLRCGDMGGYPQHGTGPGEFPGPYGAATDGADPVAEARRKVGLYIGGGGKRGGKVWDDGYTH